MDLTVFQTLLDEEGQVALAAAEALQPKEADFLAHYQQLSRQFPEALAKAALETAILRLEAGKKFPAAQQMYFTRTALEQATAYPVAAHRAARYAGYQRVYDLGCSIGGDLLALSEVAPCVGVDLDVVRLALARENLRACRPEGLVDFIQADLRAALPFNLPEKQRAARAAFCDPARRAEGRRIFSPEAYQPPFSIIQTWLTQLPALGVKISPGIRLEVLERYEAEVEFVSLGGELKECALWFGSLKTAGRRATLLPGGHSLVGDPTIRLPLSEPDGWLYEPDPAVLRAGLVGVLGEMLGASQLDPDIAYLTSAERVETPYARVWAVVDWFPFQLKRLRAYLRERQVGQVTIKKRGSPLEPEALAKQLKLKGDQHRLVFLTHLRSRPIVVIGLEA
jgi:SAM-dependent methyltransferase